MNVPRLVIAGLSGDCGKTIISLSLLGALKERGYSLSVFKKGPDYIDPAWLASVAQVPCRNLDTYLVDPPRVKANFMRGAEGCDIALVEGNRGLFDGKDSSGTHSTAALAKMLAAPVMLVVNAAKTTRTIAALVNGCVAFDPDVAIRGVVLNRVSGARHEKVIRESIERYCGLPVLGSVPRLSGGEALIPGRHLGLVTPSEFEGGKDMAARLSELAFRHLDLARILETARSAGPLRTGDAEKPAGTVHRTRIGYFLDTVFTFYYPENLEKLEASGAELVPVSSLDDCRLPDIDALYIGGGFPETQAEKLARNTSMMESVKAAAKRGMPIYAECGGLVYLSRSLIWNEHRYPMAGVFSIDLEMHEKPVGHGYALLEVDRPNPFYEVGLSIRGHEFHYTGLSEDAGREESCMRVERGTGLGHERDGLIYRNTLASYTHIHADGVKEWAPSVTSCAAEFRMRRSSESRLAGDGCCGHRIEMTQRSSENPRVSDNFATEKV